MHAQATGNGTVLRVGPVIADRMKYEIKFIHIDDHFLGKYQMARIPYLKAGDHNFVAIAKVDGYQLITSDTKMTKAAKECGVRVFTPAEFVKTLAQRLPGSETPQQ